MISKFGNMTRRRPDFESGMAGAEAAKLKKFSDASGSRKQWLFDAVRNQVLKLFEYKMRKFALCFLFFTSALAAEESLGSLWDYHPIHAGGNLIRFGSADVDAPQKGHLHFRKSNAFLQMLAPISRTSYFFPRVELNAFTLDWNKNPKFNQTHFYYMQFALTFYTTAIDQWRWIFRADYNLDLEHFSQPSLYGLFSGLFWGRHELNDQWHYHVGAFGYKGMEGQMVYPIIGFDYAPSKTWLIQAVFPITYSVEYHLNKEWRFSLKGRPLKERFRTNSSQPQPRSIFSYSTIGAEFNIHFEKFLRLEVEAYAGYNFGGNFYIKDRTGHHSLYTTVGGAPYAGLTLDYGF